MARISKFKNLMKCRSALINKQILNLKPAAAATATDTATTVQHEACVPKIENHSDQQTNLMLAQLFQFQAPIMIQPKNKEFSELKNGAIKLDNCYKLKDDGHIALN